jgi:hypothetical protein
MTYLVVSIATHLIVHVALIVVLRVICGRLALAIAFRVWLLLRRELSLGVITGSLAVGLRVRLLLWIRWFHLRFVLGIHPLRALLLGILLLRLLLSIGLRIRLVRRILRRGGRRIR